MWRQVRVDRAAVHLLVQHLKGGVIQISAISDLVISYISWDLIIRVIRVITLLVVPLQGAEPGADQLHPGGANAVHLLIQHLPLKNVSSERTEDVVVGSESTSSS